MATAIEHKMRFDAVTVISHMTKREVASMVRFLTDAIAEAKDNEIAIRIDLRNEYGGARSLISVGNNTIFGSSGVIQDSRIVNEKGE